MTRRTFAFRGNDGRHARVNAPDSLRSPVEQMLAREGWKIAEPADWTWIVPALHRSV